MNRGRNRNKNRHSAGFFGGRWSSGEQKSSYGEKLKGGSSSKKYNYHDRDNPLDAAADDDDPFSDGRDINLNDLEVMGSDRSRQVERPLRRVGAVMDRVESATRRSLDIADLRQKLKSHDEGATIEVHGKTVDLRPLKKDLKDAVAKVLSKKSDEESDAVGGEVRKVSITRKVEGITVSAQGQERKVQKSSDREDDDDDVDDKRDDADRDSEGKKKKIKDLSEKLKRKRLASDHDGDSETRGRSRDRSRDGDEGRRRDRSGGHADPARRVEARARTLASGDVSREGEQEEGEVDEMSADEEVASSEKSEDQRVERRFASKSSIVKIPNKETESTKEFDPRWDPPRSTSSSRREERAREKGEKREREKDRDKDREKDRDKERDKDRDKERERHREKERDRPKEKSRVKDREKDKDRKSSDSGKRANRSQSPEAKSRKDRQRSRSPGHKISRHSDRKSNKSPERGSDKPRKRSSSSPAGKDRHGRSDKRDAASAADAAAAEENPESPETATGKSAQVVDKRVEETSAESKDNPDGKENGLAPVRAPSPPKALLGSDSEGEEGELPDSVGTPVQDSPVRSPDSSLGKKTEENKPEAKVEKEKVEAKRTPSPAKPLGKEKKPKSSPRKPSEAAEAAKGEDPASEEIRKAQDRMKALEAEIESLNAAKEKKKRQKEERAKDDRRRREQREAERRAESVKEKALREMEKLRREKSERKDRRNRDKDFEDIGARALRDMEEKLAKLEHGKKLGSPAPLVAPVPRGPPPMPNIPGAYPGPMPGNGWIPPPRPPPLPPFMNLAPPPMPPPSLLKGDQAPPTGPPPTIYPPPGMPPMPPALSGLMPGAKPDGVMPPSAGAPPTSTVLFSGVGLTIRSGPGGINFSGSDRARASSSISSDAPPPGEEPIDDDDRSGTPVRDDTVGVEDLPPRGELSKKSDMKETSLGSAPTGAASGSSNLDPKLLAAVNSIIVCTSCKESGVAVARCSDCKTFLCQSCTDAHKVMRVFDGHRVVSFADFLKIGDGIITKHLTQTAGGNVGLAQPPPSQPPPSHPPPMPSMPSMPQMPLPFDPSRPPPNFPAPKPGAVPGAVAAAFPTPTATPAEAASSNVVARGIRQPTGSSQSSSIPPTAKRLAQRLSMELPPAPAAGEESDPHYSYYKAGRSEASLEGEDRRRPKEVSSVQNAQEAVRAFLASQGGGASEPSSVVEGNYPNEERLNDNYNVANANVMSFGYDHSSDYAGGGAEGGIFAKKSTGVEGVVQDGTFPSASVVAEASALKEGRGKKWDADRRWPKVIRDLMANNKRAYFEWKEAGMPPAPHPTFLNKTEMKKKLMKLMRQYESYEKQNANAKLGNYLPTQLVERELPQLQAELGISGEDATPAADAAAEKEKAAAEKREAERKEREKNPDEIDLDNLDEEEEGEAKDETESDSDDDDGIKVNVNLNQYQPSRSIPQVKSTPFDRAAAAESSSAPRQRTESAEEANAAAATAATAAAAEVEAKPKNPKIKWLETTKPGSPLPALPPPPQPRKAHVPAPLGWTRKKPSLDEDRELFYEKSPYFQCCAEIMRPECPHIPTNIPMDFLCAYDDDFFDDASSPTAGHSGERHVGTTMFCVDQEDWLSFKRRRRATLKRRVASGEGRDDRQWANVELVAELARQRREAFERLMSLRRECEHKTKMLGAHNVSADRKMLQLNKEQYVNLRNKTKWVLNRAKTLYKDGGIDAVHRFVEEHVEPLPSGGLNVNRVPHELLYQSLSWEQIENDSFEEEVAQRAESPVKARLFEDGAAAAAGKAEDEEWREEEEEEEEQQTPEAQEMEERREPKKPSWNFTAFVKGDQQDFQVTRPPKKDAVAVAPVEEQQQPQQDRESVLNKYDDAGTWYEGVFYRESAIPKDQDQHEKEKVPTEEDASVGGDNWKFIGGRWCRVGAPKEKERKKDEEREKERAREEERQREEREKEKQKQKEKEKEKEKQRERERERERERDRRRSETPPPPPPDPRVTNKLRLAKITGRTDPDFHRGRGRGRGGWHGDRGRPNDEVEDWKEKEKRMIFGISGEEEKRKKKREESQRRSRKNEEEWSDQEDYWDKRQRTREERKRREGSDSSYSDEEEERQPKSRRHEDKRRSGDKKKERGEKGEKSEAPESPQKFSRSGWTTVDDAAAAAAPTEEKRGSDATDSEEERAEAKRREAQKAAAAAEAKRLREKKIEERKDKAKREREEQMKRAKAREEEEERMAKEEAERKEKEKREKERKRAKEIEEDAQGSGPPKTKKLKDSEKKLADLKKELEMLEAQLAASKKKKKVKKNKDEANTSGEGFDPEFEEISLNYKAQ